MTAFKIIILSLILSFFALPKLNAQDEFSRGFGIAIKASTEGFGGDAVYYFHKRMSVRLGFEQFSLNKNFDFEEESINYDATVNYKTGSVSLLLNYNLLKYLFVSAGAGWNMFDAVVDGKAADYLQFGDIQIPKEKIGTFNFSINPTVKISPYAGIGFGRTLGLNKKVGFAFELGGFYQGSPDITIASTGLLSPTSNPDQQHEARLEKQISQYTIYPVLKMSLSYRIASF